MVVFVIFFGLWLSSRLHLPTFFLAILYFWGSAESDAEVLVQIVRWSIVQILVWSACFLYSKPSCTSGGILRTLISTLGKQIRTFIGVANVWIIAAYCVENFTMIIDITDPSGHKCENHTVQKYPFCGLWPWIPRTNCLEFGIEMWRGDFFCHGGELLFPFDRERWVFWCAWWKLNITQWIMTRENMPQATQGVVLRKMD